MGITINGLNIITANMTGSSLLTHIAIGTSGTTFTSGDTALAVETDRNQINTNDLSTNEEITFIVNYSAPEISGTILKEFGTFTGGSVMANREVLADSVVFDGENELQIQSTIKLFI